MAALFRWSAPALRTSSCAPYTYPDVAVVCGESKFDDQNQVRIEHFRLEGQRWESREHNSLDDTLMLESIQGRVAVREIYLKVDFAHSE
jgi:hypothetical protein